MRSNTPTPLYAPGDKVKLRSDIGENRNLTSIRYFPTSEMVRRKNEIFTIEKVDIDDNTYRLKEFLHDGSRGLLGFHEDWLKPVHELSLEKELFEI